MLYWINLTEIHVAGRNESFKKMGAFLYSDSRSYSHLNQLVFPLH